ncbi:Tryptophan-rich sensory protein [Halotydeus destructor]|nr:Tryptophan-rich sensory protein [Halotydeus destructor]
MAATKRIVSFFIATLTPVVLGFAASMITKDGPLSAWYQNLDKAPWNPPNWVFPVAWTIFYLLMGVASWLIYDYGQTYVGSIKTPLLWYIAQLLVNLPWNPLFFGLHHVVFSTIHILVLCVLILVTISSFKKVNSLAAILMVPYLIWGVYASSLMVWIAVKN